MDSASTFATVEQLASYLKDLRQTRRHRKQKLKQQPRRRQSLTARQRKAILLKTASRCHICGGLITDKWHADHVLAHSGGGAHAIDNYLPAHELCNNYRWDYSDTEFQSILKLGVWLRTEIERRTPLGTSAAKKFVAYDRRRVSRRKTAVR